MPQRLCPVCRIPLVERTVTSKYGTTIVLDRCPSCRGIWFDLNELYQIGLSGAESLVSDSPEAAPGVCAVPSGSRCPACGETLMGLRGGRGLAGVEHTCYCNSCGGFWLDEGDLVAFHRRRAERLAALAGEEKARLAAAARDAQAYEAFQGRGPADTGGGVEGNGAAAAAIAGAALSALAPGPAAPLVIAGLTLAERIAPFLADIVAQKLEMAKDDGRALPKSPKPRGGPRNRK